MLDPIVQSALVVLLAYLLNLAFNAIGLTVATDVLNALAAAIVAWLLGVAGGYHVANGLRAGVRSLRGK
ncbi:MAG TPA: hypothetical protein VIY48_05070 [Candidatus Paceibacterota bacterium]